MNSQVPKKCNTDLTATYIDELSLSETTEPIPILIDDHVDCVGLEMTCCSSFEFNYLLRKFDNNVAKVRETKKLFKDTVKFLNNIDVTLFDKFKFHLMDKFEETCNIKHIDLQLSRSHLMNGYLQIFDTVEKVFEKRIELRSSKICQICDYNFHKTLLKGHDKIYMNENICLKFLSNNAKDYIDLMNILWELALIREGLECVFEQMNDPEFKIEQKLIKKMGIDVDNSKVSILKSDASQITTSEISDMSKTLKKVSLNYADKAILLTDGSRSIIQYYAKEVMNSFESMNLFDRTTLPNLEQQTEINGLISHCKVVPTLKDYQECLSLCKGYFNIDIIEEQIATFLQEVVKTANKYFYLSEETKNKDSPKWRADITKDLLNEEFIKDVTVGHYLEPRFTSSQTHSFVEVDISKIDMDMIFNDQEDLYKEIYKINPYLSIIEQYRFKFIQILGAMVTLTFTILFSK